MAVGIIVHGDKKLERAFRQLRKGVVAELRPELKKIGEIVRVDAERRAVSEITNIGASWSRMRLGVIVKGVYVAPTSRNSGGSPRPNLAPLLLNQMQSALDANRKTVVSAFEDLINSEAQQAGF